MTEETLLKERFELVKERIYQIPSEEAAEEPYRAYFRKTASFLARLIELYERFSSTGKEDITLDEWERINMDLYGDILPENYGNSMANPDALAALFDGTTDALRFSQYLSWLAAEVRGAIPYVYEEWLEGLTVVSELFVQIYCLFDGAVPSYHSLQQAAYWYAFDYCDLFLGRYIRSQIDPEMDYALSIIRRSKDLRTASGEPDLRYLYEFGEYVSDDETGLAKFFAKLPAEKAERLAAVYTEGYREGFATTGKRFDIKNSVNVRYHIGMEGMVIPALRMFGEMGLKTVIFRGGSSVITKRGTYRSGYVGGDPNPQYTYDHRQDEALFYDKKYVERRLEVIRNTYEQYKELAAGLGGPAVIETFGEDPFAPENKDSAVRLSDEQQKTAVYSASRSAMITNEYIPGEERSFTIIAFPVPSIGPDFEAIFRDTVKVNTLDADLYRRIQQKLIDALDTGYAARIRGMGKNRTDLVAGIIPLSDPSKETAFENCVADVNIPVGEVFTSPRLDGTSGELHVTEVFLNGLKYLDLSLKFEDGVVTDYSCSNFDDPEKGKAYIKDTIMNNHDFLPMGEFAIGTNTTAYVMARKYGIEARMPILIAEKTGPHFAVGDTCYQHSEDIAVFNPDGKEIIARENRYSAMRRDDPEKAYFNCHTDITIPYDELGEITVLCRDGNEIPLIREGRFVLPGTEELNLPLES